MDAKQGAIESGGDHRVGRLKNLFLELWRDKTGFIGMAMIAALLFMAVAAPLIAPHSPTAQDLRARLKPPVWDENGSWNHILGTDNLGRMCFPA